MLVLASKPDEKIIINGNIVVQIIAVRGNTVRVGIEAPPEVSIHRQEVYEAIQRGTAGGERMKDEG